MPQLLEKNYMYDLRVEKLENYAVPTLVAELPPDIDAPEFRTVMSTNYGFLNLLMGSPATNSLFVTEGNSRKYKNTDYDCDTGELRVKLGKSIWTELPEDIGIACCHTKPDVDGCTSYAQPMRLCLKDCYNDLQDHWMRMVRQGFSLFGGTNAESEYWAELRAWFVFFQARDIMYGQVGVTGNNVPSFPGVLDMMNKAVVSFSGTDIIGAFEQIGCRLNILGGNYAFGGHPMTVDSIRKAVTRGDTMYRDFSMRGDTLYYKTYPIVKDINIPINIEAGTGQLWAADLNKAGVFMERNLGDPFIQTETKYNDTLTDECFDTCNFLKNYGFAFTKDFNAIFRVTDIPLDGACLGENVLFGLANIIEYETLIPDYS